MEPLLPSVEKLLLKNIPYLKQSDLDTLDLITVKKYLLFTHWLFVLEPFPLKPGKGENGQIPPPFEPEPFRDLLRAKIGDLNLEAEETLLKGRARVKKRTVINSYDATHIFWAAKRRYALEQRNVVQFPYTCSQFNRFVAAAVNYRWKQLITLYPRWRLRWGEACHKMNNVLRYLWLFLKKLPSLLKRKPKSEDPQTKG